MECEHDAVCEKIINEIDAVFHKDPDLCDFEIVHVSSNQNKNKTPVLHVENNLGLESWCVHHVYEYAHKTILATKRPAGNNIKYNSNCHNTNILKYLNFAILINPDVCTFWNVRRQLFVKNKLNITKEFQFSSIVLSKKPKSNEAFAYRRWLFSFQSGESIDWTFELGLCERCAEKNASNYHAWCHRQWVLQKAPYLLKYEIRITERFIRNHIGDYSAYSHRQHVLAKLLEQKYYDEANDEHASLKDYLNEHMMSAGQIVTGDDIVRELSRRRNIPNSIDADTKSVLYVLNIAAYDLDMCAGLTEMFGYREAIDSHRKAVLKFFVDNVRVFGNCNRRDSGGSDLYQPQEKILKINGGASWPLLESIRTAERKFGDNHRKWCEIFLGFDYSDISNDDGTSAMLLA